MIEFSGNVAQVRNAFHTEIDHYLVAGERRMANASDTQIPAALAPVVTGVVSLQNFPPASHIRVVESFHRSEGTGEVKPLFTPFESSSFFPLAPADFAKIYNVAPLLGANPPIDGTGQTIAIVGESNINVVDFRKLFGWPQNFSAKVRTPGINGSEGESDLDVQWSGAVAPGANKQLKSNHLTTDPSVASARFLRLPAAALAVEDSDSVGTEGARDHARPLGSPSNSSKISSSE